MSNTQLTLNQTTLLGATTGTISCMLLPVSGRTLLVPNVTVAEVLHDIDLIPSAEATSEAVLGDIIWQEYRLPVLSFEVLNAQPSPRMTRRVAIMNGIGPQRGVPTYALLIQDSPRVAKVKIAQLEDLENAKTGPMEFLQVRYAGEQAVIPELDAIESIVLHKH